MTSSNFNLRHLFAWISGLALSVTSLKYANGFWASGIATGLIVVLFTAVAAAIYISLPKRAFWTGFAIFGWGYLLLVDGWLSISPFSASKTLIWMLANSFGHTQADANTAYYMETPIGILRERPTEQFLRIGHSLTGLVFAILGGTLAKRFYMQSQCPPVAARENNQSTDGRS